MQKICLVSVYNWLIRECTFFLSNIICSGEMPIEELMKMYSAAENESTDLQSDEESSQESSEEGRKC